MAPTRYTVIVSGRAEAMLIQHVEFLSRVSAPAARKLSAAFRRSLNKLKTEPERFPFLDMDGIPPRLYRKCLFYERYELIFLVMGDIVHIDAVRDCRQDPDELRL